MSAPSPSRWRPSPSASARRSSWTWSARTTSRAPLTAGDRRQDRDLVAVGDRGREPLEEADVLAPQVDVDEPAQLAVVARDAGAQLAVAGVQRLERVLERLEARLDLRHLERPAHAVERLQPVAGDAGHDALAAADLAALGELRQDGRR